MLNLSLVLASQLPRPAQAQPDYGYNLSYAKQNMQLSLNHLNTQGIKLGYESVLDLDYLEINNAVFSYLQGGQLNKLDFRAFLSSIIDLPDQTSAKLSFGMWRSDLGFLSLGWSFNLQGLRLKTESGLAPVFWEKNKISLRLLETLGLSYKKWNAGSHMEISSDGQLQKYWVYTTYSVSSSLALGGLLYNNAPMLFVQFQ